MLVLRLILGLGILSVTTPAFGARTPLTDTVYLAEGTSIDITANAYGSNVLRTFCYPAKSRSLLSVFETVELILTIANDDYSQYDGRTPEEVLKHYTEQRSLFSFTLFSQKRQQIQLSPFEQQCIGIASKQPYNVGLVHTQLDLFRLLQMAIGLVIIWSAGRLAKNSVFYYLTGIVVGICASLLVLIAIASKLFPRRPMMYGVLIGGWTIGLYIIKQLANNIQLILVTYRDYVLWYLAITGMVSFLICYRIGPPKNPRSQHIVMWLLQTIGAAFVFLSSWHSSISGVLLAMNLAAYYCPESQVKYLRSFYKRRFTPKRRLLTQEEYYQASVAATARSLAELREYVNSPQCRQWTMISALRDPMRFAGFANGAPHLYDEEIEDYSRTIDASMIGTDEEEAEDILSCSMYYRPISARTGNRRPNGHHPPAPYPMNRHLPPNRHQNNNNQREESDIDDDDDDDEFMEQE